jgi:hypothetical protein
MEDTSFLRKLDRVIAPPDFERRVMAQLVQRRATLAQTRRTQVFRLSLAGAAAALLAGFLVLNMIVLRSSGPAPFADRDAAGARESVPITETMNYRNEVRAAANEPRTVYILEQVSDASNVHIKY